MKLWASSSALDTDFTAKLIDVHPPTPDYPEGIEMNPILRTGSFARASATHSNAPS